MLHSRPPAEDAGVLETLAAQAVREGGGEALEALCALLGTEYYSSLLERLRSIPGAHTATREDALQDTFLRFMEAVRAGKLKDAPGNVLGYVQRLACFTLRDRLKRRRHGGAPPENARVSQIQEIVLDPENPGPVTEIRSRENKAALQAALDQLKDDDRKVLELRYGGLPYSEIGRILGKEAEAVRKRFDYVQAKLLRLLAGEHPTLVGKLEGRRNPEAPSRPRPTAEDLRSAVEALPPEVREVLRSLHLEGKPMDEVVGRIGYEKAVARRDRGYQLLRAKFGVPFPEAFTGSGA